MNNLSSYYGLVDAKIGASDKDLPVELSRQIFSNVYWKNYAKTRKVAFEIL